MDLNRAAELYRRSCEKGIFTYTDFLNEAAQAELQSEYPFSALTFWGGAAFAERRIARFGNAEAILWKADFPLRVVKVVPRGGKFAEQMGHRDVLGAVMALGIVREKVGDIFVSPECCFVVLHQSVTDFVLQNLTDVGRNVVSTQVVEAVDESCAPKRRQVKFSAASNRLDVLVAKVFNISREKACDLILSEKVFVNGVAYQKNSRLLKSSDKVSVRGYGKFEFCGDDGLNRKGKTYFVVEIY